MGDSATCSNGDHIDLHEEMEINNGVLVIPPECFKGKYPIAASVQIDGKKYISRGMLDQPEDVNITKEYDFWHINISDGVANLKLKVTLKVINPNCPPTKYLDVSNKCNK